MTRALAVGSLYVARHAPVGAGRERQRDLRAVRDAVALVLRGAETMQEGLVRSNLDIEMTAVLFAKIHSDAIRDFELIEAHNHTMHQLAHTAMDIFVRGILSEEGMKIYEN